MEQKVNDLQQLRIHELRDLGRKMGVNAPTSKKKEDLIQEIMKIMNGESVPFAFNTKKGRPVRNNSEDFDVVDLILPSQSEMQAFNDYTYGSYDEDKMRFMVRMDVNSGYGDSEVNSVFEREGVLEIKPEKFAVIHVDGYHSSYRDVFVNMIMVNQLNLKSGDKVLAKTRKVKENYPEIAYEITKLDKETGVNFDELQSQLLIEKVNILANDIKEFHLGGRYYVNPSYDSYRLTCDLVKEIQKLDVKNLQVSALYLNAMMERLPYESEINMTAIPFSRPDEEVIMGTNLYFERLKRYAESGMNVVCVINEISQYAKSYNNIYINNNNFQDVSSKASYMTKALFSNAKYTDKGSITIIAIDKLRVPTNIENMFKYEILPILNETIK